MTTTINSALCKHLTDILEANRAELVDNYQQLLRDAMFNGRSTMRPNMVKKIAADEVDAFIKCLQQPEWNALERGVQLHQFGLSEKALVRLGQVTRQFFIKYLESDQIAPTLELIDTYQEQVVQGFIQSLEAAVFTVQERTRHAFERVINRNKS